MAEPKKCGYCGTPVFYRSFVISNKYDFTPICAVCVAEENHCPEEIDLQQSTTTYEVFQCYSNCCEYHQCAWVFKCECPPCFKAMCETDDYINSIKYNSDDLPVCPCGSNEEFNWDYMRKIIKD